MISFLIWVLILLIVMSLAWWILGQIPLPDPIKKIATIVLVVVCAFILIYMLMGLAGGPNPFPAPRWR